MLKKEQIGDLCGRWRTDTGQLVLIKRYEEMTGYYEGELEEAPLQHPLVFDYQGYCINLPVLVGKIIRRQIGVEKI